MMKVYASLLEYLDDMENYKSYHFGIEHRNDMILASSKDRLRDFCHNVVQERIEEEKSCLAALGIPLHRVKWEGVPIEEDMLFKPDDLIGQRAFIRMMRYEMEGTMVFHRMDRMQRKMFFVCLVLVVVGGVLGHYASI